MAAQAVGFAEENEGSRHLDVLSVITGEVADKKYMSGFMEAWT
jgi:hypothetical protein